MALAFLNRSTHPGMACARSATYPCGTPSASLLITRGRHVRIIAIVACGQGLWIDLSGLTWRDRPCNHSGVGRSPATRTAIAAVAMTSLDLESLGAPTSWQNAKDHAKCALRSRKTTGYSWRTSNRQPRIKARAGTSVPEATMAILPESHWQPPSTRPGGVEAEEQKLSA